MTTRHQFARVALIFYGGIFLAALAHVGPDLGSLILRLLCAAIALAFGSRLVRIVSSALLLLAIFPLITEFREESQRNESAREMIEDYRRDALKFF